MVEERRSQGAAVDDIIICQEIQGLLYVRIFQKIFRILKIVLEITLFICGWKSILPGESSREPQSLLKLKNTRQVFTRQRF